MARRLAFTILVTVLGASTVLTACADDEDGTDGVTGGEAGSESGGSSSGGTSAGEGGSLTAGGAGGEMQGGASQGGAGHAGMTAEGGDGTVGGAPVGGGAATDGGGAATDGGGGAGGADNPPVAYACGDTTLSRRLCSGYAAAECDSLPACVGEPPPDPCCTDCAAPSCPDCVAQADVDRETFTECSACLAEYDRSLLCSIDPFEAGNLSDGIACFDGYGAYQKEDCDPLLFSALDCLDYIVENPCPASWPLE